MKNGLLLFLLVTSWYNLSAQTVWELDLGKKLKDTKYLGQSGDGTVLTTIGGEITGVDPKSGEIKFQYKPKTGLLGRPSFRPIPNTPLLEVRAKGNYLLVDCINNEVLFDYGSKENKVKAAHHLLSEGAILFEHKIEKESYVGLGKIGEEDLIWDVNLGRVKTGLFVSSLMSKSRTEGFLAMEPIVYNDIVILVLKKEIICIDRSIGEISWRKPYEKNLNNVFIDDGSNTIYVFYHDKIGHVNLEDGSDVKPELKLPGQVIDVIEQDNKYDLLMTNGLNFYYPESHTIKWPETKKIGNIHDYYVVDNGYLGVYSGKDGKHRIYKIDPNGQGEWSEELPGALVQLIPNKEGIFYLTKERANILDYEKGRKKWKKDISFDEYTTFAYDEQIDRVLYFGDKKLKRFDPETGFAEELRKKIEFKKYKKEEDAVYLSTRDNGYLMRTDQHLIYLDREGELIYQRFYSPADISGLMRTVASVGYLAGAGLAMAEVAGSVKTGMEGVGHRFVGDPNVAQEKYQSAYRQADRAILVGEIGGSIGSYYLDTYSNTQVEKDNIYLTTRIDKQNYVAKINMENGKLINKFLIEGKEPLYQVDYERN